MMAAVKRGKFIVFEGIDGSGKGTQIKRIAGWLFDLSKEYDIYVTREPTRDFKVLRQAMATDGAQVDDRVKSKAQWYAEGFVRDRQQHLQRHIQPALEGGTHVLLDRYKYSTLAYQHLQGMDLDVLVDMHAGMLVPDLVILCDCAASVAFQRRAGDNATDVFDKDAAFQASLRDMYLSVMQHPSLAGENIAVVNTEGSIESITQEIQKHILAILD